MNMLNLTLTTDMFPAFLLLILICFDCSLSDNTSPTGTFIKSSKSMDGRIHNWTNRNLSHIDTSTQFTSTERDSSNTSVAPEQQPKNCSQSLIHVFLSNKSSIGTFPTPNRVRKLKLVGNGSGEYEFLDEFLASHKIFEIFIVSLRSKHLSQNSNNSFDENDSPGSSSSDLPTFILSDEKIERVSGTEENRTAQLFNCSDISLDVTDQDDIQMKNFKLKIKHLSRPGVMLTVCRIVKEDKVIQTYPALLGIIMSIFSYSFVSLFCAWTLVISVSKFFMLYIVLNIITYFLICMMLTGSVTEVIIDFFPFHLNFMFILVTGWITLMFFEVVSLRLEGWGVVRIANSKVFGNISRMFQLAMVISLLMPLLSVPFLLPDILSCNNTFEQEVCSKYPSLDYVLLFTRSVWMVIVFIIYATEGKQVENRGFQYSYHHLMCLCYHISSVVSWLFGVLVIGLHSTVPQFWHLYLFVAALLPLSFLKDCLIANRAKVLFHVTEKGKTETVRQV